MRENEQWLTNHFLNENNETRGGALTNEQRMKIFLRYLSDPGFQSGVAEDIRSSIGIFLSTIRLGCNIIWALTSSLVVRWTEKRRQAHSSIPANEPGGKYCPSMYREVYYKDTVFMLLRIAISRYFIILIIEKQTNYFYSSLTKNVPSCKIEVAICQYFRIIFKISLR
ncbi:hypothetical protein C0J52_27512 [Blattella germanica]|nr:hypothetical protein C0J52_27512 [Blattella germanica]